MKKAFFWMAVFSAAATLQAQDIFQIPNAQDFFQAPAPPAPPAAPAAQTREVNVGPFGVGGTYLGVNLAELDANRARELKLKETYGVEITRVEDNSPAEKAGLK